MRPPMTAAFHTAPTSTSRDILFAHEHFTRAVEHFLRHTPSNRNLSNYNSLTSCIEVGQRASVSEWILSGSDRIQRMLEARLLNSLAN